MTTRPRTTPGATLPEALARTLAAGRLPPSVLLEGPDPEALAEVARAVAAALLCRKGGCGACRACRLVAAGTHPDLHVVGKDKATVISVAALAPVLERAHTKPLEGPRQVFWISPAEAMEPEGVARYLKSLEEPPEGTVFLLATTRPERLPDTVLSRCRRVRLPPLSAEEVAARLVADGGPEAASGLLGRLAAGSLTRARRMARAGVVDVAAALVAAARSPTPGAGGAALAALAALERAAKEEAEGDDGEAEADEGAAGRGRQGLRESIQDLLHAFGADARDAAAGREPAWLAGLAPDGALALLKRLGELAAATAANVTPAAVMLETVSALRAALRGRS